MSEKCKKLVLAPYHIRNIVKTIAKKPLLTEINVLCFLCTIKIEVLIDHLVLHPHSREKEMPVWRQEMS